MPVRRVIDAPELAGLGFEILAGSDNLDSRRIKNPRIQKPGLALAGFLPYVKGGRLQIVGNSEYAYLRTLGDVEAIKRWFSLIDAGVPAIVSAKGIRPPDEVLEYCQERGVPFLLSSAATSVVISTISIFLERELAPTLQIHGVLMDVFSMGTLIVGD
ncbi:MAG TPA: HPr kinase/phosphorylase, partial [Acidobacteria bacterium]|nr:HPr kinase/phosphorylase [Acidobacteriota bacterium]